MNFTEAKSPNFCELWILTYFPSVGGSDRIRVRAAAASSKAQETLEVNLLSTWNDQRGLCNQNWFWFFSANSIFCLLSWNRVRFSARVFKNQKKTDWTADWEFWSKQLNWDSVTQLIKQSRKFWKFKLKIEFRKNVVKR